MFWIIFNLVFSAFNFVLAINADTVGWAVFSAFCSGICFAMFIVALAAYAPGYDPNV